MSISLAIDIDMMRICCVRIRVHSSGTPVPRRETKAMHGRPSAPLTVFRTAGSATQMSECMDEGGVLEDLPEIYSAAPLAVADAAHDWLLKSMSCKSNIMATIDELHHSYEKELYSYSPQLHRCKGATHIQSVLVRSSTSAGQE